MQFIYPMYFSYGKDKAYLVPDLLGQILQSNLIDNMTLNYTTTSTMWHIFAQLIFLVQIFPFNRGRFVTHYNVRIKTPRLS